jgi:hypothetical protein
LQKCWEDQNAKIEMVGGINGTLKFKYASLTLRLHSHPSPEMARSIWQVLRKFKFSKERRKEERKEGFL